MFKFYQETRMGIISFCNSKQAYFLNTSDRFELQLHADWLEAFYTPYLKEIVEI